MCYLRTDHTVFSILSQWAEVMQEYRLTGSASVLGSTRTSHCGPHTISARQGMILAKGVVSSWRPIETGFGPAFAHH